MKRLWNALVANAIEHSAGQAELERLAKSRRTPGELRLLLQREIAFLGRLARAQREFAPPRGFQTRLGSLLQRLQTGLPAVVLEPTQDAPGRHSAGRERDVLAAERTRAKKGRPGKSTRGRKR